ncbi:MAG: class I tRNA ligase family protein [Rickettsiales bacterium]|jgi:methionyl-tRNA synthetase|nr:class I tRNA ligase family protein [Rickettsiales bacterium]
MNKKYITTPIYYLNGEPHIGHAYTTVMADILRRIFRNRGLDTFMTSGADEHGQKNQEACEKSGISFAEYSNGLVDRFLTVFRNLDAAPDFYIRTSMPGHKEIVKQWLEAAHDAGILIKKNYTGMYCVGCEQFKKESDLDERGFCPDHQKPPVETVEENYFLPLEPHRQWLREYIKNNPDWIQPASYATEILNMLDEPLDDLNISRPKSRVSLGIEFPFDTDYITYIWYDALINYITSLKLNKPGEDDAFWDESIHLIGKDIAKPHCIYWPIMLRVMGIKPPKHIFIHAFWTAAGGIKMSKSLGNAVVPGDITARFGSDAVRFYMARNAPISRDAPMTPDLVATEYDVLANNFGNLQMRIAKMSEKFGAGGDANLNAEFSEFIGGVESALKNAMDRVENLAGIQALAEEILRTSTAMNQFIDRTEPWKLAKDSESADLLAGVMNVLNRGAAALMTAAAPIMPGLAARGNGALFPKLDENK